MIMRTDTARKNKRRFLTALFCISGFLFIGCGNTTEENITESDYVAEESKAVVKATRGRLTPTRSENTSVVKATPFVMNAPHQGKFMPKISSGAEVKKGAVLGTMDQEEIKAPVDAAIVSVEKEGTYPQNYPLMELQYLGFSLMVDAGDFLATIPDHASLNARFQIRDVTGPEDILAVVLSENEEGSPEILQCLIGQDITVKQGQNATVVITAERKDDSLLLPISAVAGRIKKGMVNLIEGGKETVTEVTLGANDGAYIEILSGVKEGDEVSAIPPNLDLRTH